MKVLIVHESEEVAKTIELCVSIRWPGSSNIWTSKGSEAQHLVETEGPDLVLLGLDLFDTDGLKVLEEIRSFSDVPIIVISDRNTADTRTESLEAGADRFIAVPFSHLVLLAVMRVLLRRAGCGTVGLVGPILLDGFTVDLEGRRVIRNGKDVPLTPIQWSFLAYMARNAGKVIPHQTLADKVWGGGDLSIPAIKMCVHQLRKRLGDNLRSPKLLRSHRGIGYSLAASP